MSHIEEYTRILHANVYLAPGITHVYIRTNEDSVVEDRDCFIVQNKGKREVEQPKARKRTSAYYWDHRRAVQWLVRHVFVYDQDYQRMLIYYVEKEEVILLRGGSVIRTHDGPKNPYAPLFSRTILGPD